MAESLKSKFTEANARLAPVAFDYKQVELPDTEPIAPYGIDGWELVAVVRAARMDNVIAYFKRRK